MVVQAGYPGVYIQEIPSGVRTIIGASTSNLAILGSFARGPVGTAVGVTSWDDFARRFGGLDRRCDASYAIEEFYRQGGAGSTAFIVRVGFTQAELTLTGSEPAMTIRARQPGVAGNDIAVGFSHNPDGTFDLVVSPSAALHASREVFTRLSATPGAAGFVEARLNAPRAAGGSELVDVVGAQHRPAETVPGTAAGSLAYANLTRLSAGAAVTEASLSLPPAPAAARLVVTARAPGASGNAIRIAIRNNGSSEFDLLVRADATTPPELFTGLSMTGTDANFAETVVNDGIGSSPGSALIELSGVTGARPDEILPAGFSTTAPLTNVQYTDMAPLADGLDAVTAAARPTSEALPALTLQANLPGAAGNALTAAVTEGSGGRFQIVVAGAPSGSVTLTNLTIDPADADYAVARLAGTGVASVVLGRHPLRVPATAAAAPFARGGEPVPTARVSLTTAAGTPACTVQAANPGAWGNTLRVGVGAGAGGGFDLTVVEYRGEDAIRREVFRNLNTIPGDPNNAVAAIAATSELIRLADLAAAPAPTRAGVDADELRRAELVPLAGGADGVRPGDPAWAANAGAQFTSALPALDEIYPEIFNIMVIPEAPQMIDGGFAIYAAAGAYCDANLAFLLVDHPDATDTATGILNWNIAGALGSNLARSAALCFPRVVRADPLASGMLRELPSSGSIAGVMARTDGQRGVWKAPAGLDASLAGVAPSVVLTDLQQGRLNKRGLNSLRSFANVGTVAWGARTLAGADSLASEWKYVPVRRTALFIERSLKTALAWVVFEPNDEPLWAQIRLNVGAFMQSLFVRGAFEGQTPTEAYLVRCDRETTSQQDVNSGIVNILVGFRPLKPAEFVVIRLQQLAGQPAA